ncbi:hypothetical protein PG988_010346 [Apiospora saccharicola]
MTARVLLHINHCAEQRNVVAGFGVLFHAPLHQVPWGPTRQPGAEQRAHGRATEQRTHNLFGSFELMVRLNILDGIGIVMRSNTSGNALEKVLEGGLATSNLLGGSVNVAHSVRRLLVGAYSAILLGALAGLSQDLGDLLLGVLDDLRCLLASVLDLLINLCVGVGNDLSGLLLGILANLGRLLVGLHDGLEGVTLGLLDDVIGDVIGSAGDEDFAVVVVRGTVLVAGIRLLVGRQLLAVFAGGGGLLCLLLGGLGTGLLGGVGLGALIVLGARIALARVGSGSGLLGFAGRCGIVQLEESVAVKCGWSGLSSSSLGNSRNCLRSRGSGSSLALGWSGALRLGRGLVGNNLVGVLITSHAVLAEDFWRLVAGPASASGSSTDRLTAPDSVSMGAALELTAVSADEVSTIGSVMGWSATWSLEGEVVEVPVGVLEPESASASESVSALITSWST